MIVHTVCRFFRGDVPCRPHKDAGVHCESCTFYDPIKEKILIIKLGAIGDVIRTTPLIKKIRHRYPQAEISWITNYPDVIPSEVDKVYTFAIADILTLLTTPYDILYNLDKDKEACSLAVMVKADIKKGFYLREGKCHPFDEASYHKWLTGIFDDISRKNTKSYLEEIFAICGFEYCGEEYMLDGIDVNLFKGLKKKKLLIGLNTGCGNRWNTRIWPEKHWVGLARKLKKNTAEVVLLGGPDEDEKNKRIAKASGCVYLGTFPIKQFASLVDQCDLIVTGVTMAFHVALALKKKIVLLNNVFNRNEFELYNLGVIVEPPVECLGCYKTSCEKECMELIKPNDIVKACSLLIKGIRG